MKRLLVGPLRFRFFPALQPMPPRKLCPHQPDFEMRHRQVIDKTQNRNHIQRQRRVQKKQIHNRSPSPRSGQNKLAQPVRAGNSQETGQSAVNAALLPELTREINVFRFELSANG